MHLISVRSSWPSSDPRVYIPCSGAHEKSMEMQCVIPVKAMEPREKPPSPESQAHLHVCWTPRGHTRTLTLWGTLEGRPRVLMGFRGACPPPEFGEASGSHLSGARSVQPRWLAPRGQAPPLCPSSVLPGLAQPLGPVCKKIIICLKDVKCSCNFNRFNLNFKRRICNH